MKKQVAVEVPKVATARFIVQMPTDAAPSDFETLIPTEQGLRQQGEATFRSSDTLAELSVNVEYGPALGTLNATLLDVLRRMAKRRTAITASDMFNYRDRVATKGEIEAEVARLDAEGDDIALPLTRRKELSKKADQLRVFVGGCHV